jgi:hypothetical protein
MRIQYSLHVNSKRTVLLALLAAVAFIGSGCGGLGASGSISPATFLLPGIGQNTPARPADNGHSSERSSVVAITAAATVD